METVTLPANFQFVIPQSIRDSLHLKPGEKFRVFCYAGKIEFIRARPIQEMRGFLRGMDAAIKRE